MPAGQHRGKQNAGSRLQVRDVLAALGDFACDVASEDVRELDAREPFANPQIKMVQRAGANANENVVFAQFRIGSIFVLEDLGSTEFVNADGFHVLLLV
jgi:hypothetical protein